MRLKETCARPEHDEQAYTRTGSRKSELWSRPRVGKTVVVVVFIEQLDARVYTSCCVKKKGKQKQTGGKQFSCRKFHLIENQSRTKPDNYTFHS